MNRLPTLRRLLRGALLAATLAASGPPAQAADAPLHRIEAQRPDGSRWTLADSRGRVTVLVLWSPESLASRKSLGELARFAVAATARGLELVAAATLAEPAALRHFVAERRLELPWAMLAGHDLGRLRVEDLPLVLVFDRDGALRAGRRGLFRLDDLERLVAPLP